MDAEPEEVIMAKWGFENMAELDTGAEKIGVSIVARSSGKILREYSFLDKETEVELLEELYALERPGNASL